MFALKYQDSFLRSATDLLKSLHHNRMLNLDNWGADQARSVYETPHGKYQIEHHDAHTVPGYSILSGQRVDPPYWQAKFFEHIPDWPDEAPKPGTNLGRFRSVEDAASAASTHTRHKWNENNSPEYRAASLRNWDRADSPMHPIGGVAGGPLRSFPLEWDDGVTDKYAHVHGFTNREKFNATMQKYREREASFSRHRGSPLVDGGDMHYSLMRPDHRWSNLYAVHQAPNGKYTLSVHPHRHNDVDVEQHRHGFQSEASAKRAAADHAQGTRARAFEHGHIEDYHGSQLGGHSFIPGHAQYSDNQGMRYHVYDRGSSDPSQRWGAHIGHSGLIYSERQRPVTSFHPTKEAAHAAAYDHIKSLKLYGQKELPIGSPQDVQRVAHNAVDRGTLTAEYRPREKHKALLNPSEFHILSSISSHKSGSASLRKYPDQYRVIKSLARAPRASRDQTPGVSGTDWLYRGTGIRKDWLHHFEKVGNKFHAGHGGCWTSKPDVTRDFVDHETYNLSPQSTQALVFHLKNPKYGTKIANIGDHQHEQEHVTGGNFRITKVIGKDDAGHHHVEVEHLPHNEQPRGWHKAAWDMYGTKPPPTPVSSKQLRLPLKIANLVKSIKDEVLVPPLDKSMSSEGDWVPQEVSDYLAEALSQRPPNHVRRLNSLRMALSKAWVAGIADHDADGSEATSADVTRRGKPLRGPYGEPLKESQKLRDAAKRIKNK